MTTVLRRKLAAGGQCRWTHSVASLALAVALSLFGPSPATVQADVLALGNVLPEPLPTFGGQVVGDLLVGITDIGRLTIDGPTFTLPLVADGGVIGVTAGGIGEVAIAGFTSELAINVFSTLVPFKVGGAGQGFLSLIGGARVDIFNFDGEELMLEGMMVVGDAFNSEGFVSIEGFGSFLKTGELTLGQFGTGTIDVFNRGAIKSTTATLGAMNGSVGRARLSGLGTRWFNEGDMEIGTFVGSDDDENGHGILEIGIDAVVTVGVVDTSSEGFDSGTTNVNDLGRVELSQGGRLLTYDLNNFGVIRGDGWIQATNSFVIEPSGELRNAAGIANLRERIYVADSVVEVENFGTIESLGGEMEFEGPVENNLEIIARDAVMRFNGGLTNNGDVVLGGDTEIHAPGTVVTGGGLYVLADSEALIIGDLTFTGGALGLAIGQDGGTLDVVGAIDLGGTTLEVDYSSGVLSQPGDTYQVLSSTEPILGDFSNTQVVADGRLWDITGLGTNTIYVTATLETISDFSADFDSDGDVDGRDFMIWQTGVNTGNTFAEGDATLNSTIDGTDLSIWELQYGDGAAPVTAEFATVPEPAAGLLLLLGMAAGVATRWRR